VAFENRYNQTAKPFQWKFNTTDLTELGTRLDNHKPEPKRGNEKLDPKGGYAGPLEWPKDNELEYRPGPQLYRLPRRQRALPRPRHVRRTP
jgi:hypothetical protein